MPDENRVIAPENQSQEDGILDLTLRLEFIFR